MKFYSSYSEAMREGAKLRPQIFGMFATKNGSCALSAGAEAVTGGICRAAGVNRVLAMPEYEYMEAVRTEGIPCPGCDDAVFECLRDVALHLNDGHKWTREKIADFVESEEEKLGFVTIEVTQDQTPSSIQSVGERVGV